MDLQGDSSLYIKERWEKESGITISTQDWNRFSVLYRYSFGVDSAIL